MSIKRFHHFKVRVLSTQTAISKDRWPNVHPTSNHWLTTFGSNASDLPEAAATDVQLITYCTKNAIKIITRSTALAIQQLKVTFALASTENKKILSLNSCTMLSDVRRHNTQRTSHYCHHLKDVSLKGSAGVTSHTVALITS